MPAVLLCLAPILVLLAVTVIKPLQLPSRASLPLAAVLMLVVRTAYLVSDPLDVVADALAGCLEAAVPRKHSYWSCSPGPASHEVVTHTLSLLRHR